MEIKPYEEYKNRLGLIYSPKMCTDLYAIITEIYINDNPNDIVNETSGFLKFPKGLQFKVKLKWFFENHRESYFSETILPYELIEKQIEYSKNKPLSPNDFNSLKVGSLVTLRKRAKLEKDKKDETKTTETAISLINFSMAVIDIEKNKEQSKFGNPTIIRPEFLVKCKWYNAVQNKFSEEFFPLEALVKV
ncbi:MAG: hypothetical protein ACOVQA_02165 [Thermoflexibacteraceae bacterium]